MLYREIEAKLISSYGNSSLDDWIIKCSEDELTRNIAFNLFCDIHYFKLSGTALYNGIDQIEKHLRLSDVNIDPIDRIKGAIKIDFPNLWDTNHSNINNITKLKRFISTDEFNRILMPFRGDSFSKIPLKDKIKADELIENFKDISKTNPHLPFSNGLIIWSTPSIDVEQALNRPDISEDHLHNNVRDILGLDHLQDVFLVEIEFPTDESNPNLIPNVFHSKFYPFFMPKMDLSYWGMTQDLNNLQDSGCRESVQKTSNWPSSEIKPLGLLSFRKGAYNWESCLTYRINYFKYWANKDTAKLADLDYFLSKKLSYK